MKKKKTYPVNLKPKATETHRSSGVVVSNSGSDAYDTDKIPVSEEYSSEIENLLRLGLADKTKLEAYKRVLKNPKYYIKLSEYRAIILDVLEKLITQSTEDSAIYNKMQQNLMRKKYIKEEKKKKKVTIPPTQRVDSMRWHPLSGDTEQYAEEETPMSDNRISVLKELVREKVLDETAYGKYTVGAPKRPRRVRRATKPKSASLSLITKARQRILKAQQNLVRMRKQQATLRSQEERFKQKQAEVQQQAQRYQ